MTHRIPLSPDVLERFAGYAISTLRESSGLELSCDQESVFKLDQWINEHRHELSPAGIDALGLIFGAFLGECMRRELGGVWEESDGTWAIRLPRTEPAEKFSECIEFPIRKAHRHLLEGESQSIASMFMIASALCDPNLDPSDLRYELRRQFLQQIESALEDRRTRGPGAEQEVLKVSVPRIGPMPEESELIPDRTRLRLTRFREAFGRTLRWGNRKGGRDVN